MSVQNVPLREASAELEALVERTRGLQPLRRVLHAANGVLVAFAPTAVGLSHAQAAWLLGGVFVVLALGDVVRLRAPQLNLLFFKSFPSLASPREASHIASSTWYALGTFLTWVLFPPSLAIPAILVLAFADPAASVIGRLLGARALGKGSIVGSLAFFAVAAGVLLAATGELVVLPVAALVALVEVAPWKVDDNLTIPLSAALLLSLVGL